MHPPQRSFEFPSDYCTYFGDNHVLKREYLIDLPERIAIFLEDEVPPLTMHQLRAFYAHAKRAEDAWDRGLPLALAVKEVQKLVSLANDRLGKRKITQTFHDFLRSNAMSLKADDDGRTLRAFLEHFEALVGFCAGRLNEKERT